MRNVILAFSRSYGLISIFTVSPAAILMKFFLSLPEMCARTTWPGLFSSSTLNIVPGSTATTLPSTSIASLSGMVCCGGGRRLLYGGLQLDSLKASSPPLSQGFTSERSTRSLPQALRRLEPGQEGKGEALGLVVRVHLPGRELERVDGDRAIGDDGLGSVVRHLELLA